MTFRRDLNGSDSLQIVFCHQFLTLLQKPYTVNCNAVIYECSSWKNSEINLIGNKGENKEREHLSNNHFLAY